MFNTVSTTNTSTTTPPLPLFPQILHDIPVHVYWLPFTWGPLFCVSYRSNPREYEGVHVIVGGDDVMQGVPRLPLYTIIIM